MEAAEVPIFGALEATNLFFDVAPRKGDTVVLGETAIDVTGMLDKSPAGGKEGSSVGFDDVFGKSVLSGPESANLIEILSGRSPDCGRSMAGGSRTGVLAAPCH